MPVVDPLLSGSQGGDHKDLTLELAQRRRLQEICEDSLRTATVCAEEDGETVTTLARRNAEAAIGIAVSRASGRLMQADWNPIASFSLRSDSSLDLVLYSKGIPGRLTIRVSSTWNSLYPEWSTDAPEPRYRVFVSPDSDKGFYTRLANDIS